MPRSRQVVYGKIAIHVYLRRPDKENFHQVRLVAYFHGTDFSVSPGLRILPFRVTGKKREELFEPKTGRVLSTHPDATKLNGQLQAWQQKIEDAFWKLAGPLGLTPVTREMMEQEMFPEAVVRVAVVEPKQLTFTQHYQQWVKDYTGIHKESYLRKFKHVPEQIETWRPKTVAGDLSESFCREYLKDMLSRKQADGSIAKQYKFLRIVAERIGLSSKASWLHYSDNAAPQLDLEKDELRKLILVHLEDPRLSEERDRWLLQCFTGRRDADMQELRAEQLTRISIDNETSVAGLIHGQTKTSKQVVVPIPPMAVAIGERWEWSFPYRTNQTRNDWIKRIAKEAGLNRLFNDLHISGGNMTDNYRPVHELIGTHSARHTAGSLILEGSEGDKSLSGYLLGHATTGNSNTDIYAKDKARRVAPKLLQAWQQVLGDLYEATPNWVSTEEGGPVRHKQARNKKKK
ncbi:hypothetical protein [Hymenobacter sp. YC55]|uniref:hypothetical protein n=1 Tax=Hymenobacter sp. YC55 TaxID=3034019 RepID=UPI0023F85EC4|nr:hypothetical protein [Hymenobacter sp. YC55]MDF7810679.1 hypothetical protein [Hymenobacter sp. YC55]